MTDKARELLERCRVYFYHTGLMQDLGEEIRAYLAEQKQYDALADRYVEGVTGGLKNCREYMEAQVWVAKELLKTPESTQDEEPVAWIREVDIDNPISALVRTQHECGDCNIPLYLHPAPRPEFVRLSEEEIVSWWGVATEAGLIEFARAIEDALKEKNK